MPIHLKNLRTSSISACMSPSIVKPAVSDAVPLSPARKSFEVRVRASGKLSVPPVAVTDPLSSE